MNWKLAALAALIAALVSPAQALTMQECSARYKDAQKAGTLGGKSWNDFRKAECGAQEAAAKGGEAKSAAVSKPASLPTVSNAKFPASVDAKYAKETQPKARMKSCLDQYNANKAADANGGMKWIQKGGGYYSECNKRLKGTV